MATITAFNSGASLGVIIKYVTKPSKTNSSLVSGTHCEPSTVIDEMKLTKAMYCKEGGRQYKHYCVSFDAREKVTPELAHTMARLLCEKHFAGRHEILLATHIDRNHVHTHIIVNSVSHVDGLKFQEPKSLLQEMKNEHDKLCLANGLSIVKKGFGFDSEPTKKVSTYGQPYANKIINEGMNESGVSWKTDIADAAISAMQVAVSRNDYIALMWEQGYEVAWSDNRKHITFIDNDGNKIRNSNIAKTFNISFSKEGLENAFEANTAREQSGELDSALDEYYIQLADVQQRIREADTRDFDRKKTENRAEEERRVDSEAGQIDSATKFDNSRFDAKSREVGQSRGGDVQGRVRNIQSRGNGKSGKKGNIQSPTSASRRSRGAR